MEGVRRAPHREMDAAFLGEELHRLADREPQVPLAAPLLAEALAGVSSGAPATRHASLHLERPCGGPPDQLRRDRLVILAAVAERPALRVSPAGFAG